MPSWRARCWACGVLAVLSGASITCLVASPNSPPAAATPLPSAAVDPSCQALSRRTRALHALVLSSRPRPSPESESTSMAITAAAASSSSMSSQPMWQRREVAGWADEHGSALLMGGQTSDQFGSGLHYPKHPLSPAALKLKYMCSHCGVLKKARGTSARRPPKKWKGSSARAVVKRTRK